MAAPPMGDGTASLPGNPLLDFTDDAGVTTVSSSSHTLNHYRIHLEIVTVNGFVTPPKGLPATGVSAPVVPFIV